MNFSELFIRRPVTTTMLMTLLIILGMMGFSKISMDLFPDVDFPVVVVSTVYPGAAPAEVEELLSKPIEEAISSVNGLDTIHSYSNEGVSTVVAQFDLEIDNKVASQDVREKVSMIRGTLPEGIVEPSILLFDPASAPIAAFAINGPQTPMELTDYVEDVLKPKLERINGVGSVDLLGGRVREIHIDLDPTRLKTYGLSVAGLYQTLKADGMNLPGGRITENGQELSLRAMGKFQTVSDIANFQVATPSGARVRMGDLGKVWQSIADPRSLGFVNNQPAVMFNIFKQSGANTVAVVDNIQKEFKKLEATLPPGATFTTVQDSSKFIKESNHSVWEHLIIGGLLAVAILFAFLRNWRATLIGGMAIPISMIATFWTMQLMGFSFNMLTTLALTLVVGIVVDDAVVDLENIYRHMEKGEPPLRAAINATGEIQLAVTACTLTIVAVFVPVAFMTGMIGQFFKEFGLTVAFAVLFSLLVARTITPMISARFLKVSKGKGGMSADAEHSFPLAKPYRKVLEWSLKNRWKVMGIAVASFVFGMALVPFIPKTFMTSADRGEFHLKVQLPKGATLEETGVMSKRVVDVIKQHPEVENVFTTIGGREEVDFATLGVILVDKGKRNIKDVELAEKVRNEIGAIPGIRAKVMLSGMIGGASEMNTPINISLRGSNLEELRVYGEKMADLLRSRSDLFADVDTSLALNRPEVQLQIDRARAAAEGVSSAALANTLRIATTGEVVGTMIQGDDELDIRLQVAPDSRQSLTAIKALSVPGNRSLVPVSAVVTEQVGSGVSTIRREDRERVVNVLSNLMPGASTGEAFGVVEQLKKELDLPESIAFVQGGEAEQMADAFTGLLQALGLAIVFVYIILAVQFESFIHPFTIMFSLPLSIAGAFLALLVTQSELGMMAMIGVIMLMGIVTKNAILVVDFTLQLKDQGRPTMEALLEACPVRLRPILMTTAAMVMGMLPMAAGIGAGAEFRYPMAVVVVGGLITSTLLTLIVVPVGFSLMDDFQNWYRRKFLHKEGPTTRMAAVDAPAEVAL
ncbi:Multidrug resistance protein MdtC [compost metagenome]